jgi:glycosyltransferase involved in cell wall biosynthesis
MRVAVIGGIFDKPQEYRAMHQTTPETTLVRGLAARGHDVFSFGHHEVPALDSFDVIHVHHASYGAIRAAIDPGPAALVFTSHRSAIPAGARGWGMRFVIERSDELVALSERERRWYVAMLGVERERVHVIPNGIDERTFWFAEPPEATGNWRLLFVGQLVPLKGADVLLRAVARLSGRHSVSVDLVCHVDSGVVRLRGLAKELGISERVTFVGAQPGRRLVHWYHRASALVLPSRSDQLPSVVTEAMLAGCPVVASDVGSIREQLCGQGILVPPGDPEALSRGLEELFAQYVRYRAKLPEARARAEARYSVGGMVANHERLYESLCDRPGQPRRHTDRQPLRAIAWRGMIDAWTALKTLKPS